MILSIKNTRKSVPLILMILVFVAPFFISVWTLQHADELNDRAKGEWLSQTIYVPPTDAKHWQVLWKETACNGACADLIHRLNKLQLALGKYQTELHINGINESQLPHSKSLFIADRNGLVLLAYDGSQDGLYKIFKDLKVLMKHGGS